MTVGVGVQARDSGDPDISAQPCSPDTAPWRLPQWTDSVSTGLWVHDLPRPPRAGGGDRGTSQKMLLLGPNTRLRTSRLLCREGRPLSGRVEALGPQDTRVALDAGSAPDRPLPSL